MRGNVWLHAGSNILGPYSGIPIRLASYINHVTSHALTMVTHLTQKTNVNAGDQESDEGIGLISEGR